MRKNKRSALLLDNALGNLYRAAFFLARKEKGKQLAREMLRQALAAFQRANVRVDPKLIRFEKQIVRVKNKKERLVLAELILDEYKRMVRSS